MFVNFTHPSIFFILNATYLKLGPMEFNPIISEDYTRFSDERLARETMSMWEYFYKKLLIS